MTQIYLGGVGWVGHSDYDASLSSNWTENNAISAEVEAELDNNPTYRVLPLSQSRMVTFQFL